MLCSTLEIFDKGLASASHRAEAGNRSCTLRSNVISRVIVPKEAPACGNLDSLLAAKATRRVLKDLIFVILLSLVRVGDLGLAPRCSFDLQPEDFLAVSVDGDYQNLTVVEHLGVQPEVEIDIDQTDEKKDLGAEVRRGRHYVVNEGLPVLEALCVEAPNESASDHCVAYCDVQGHLASADQFLLPIILRCMRQGLACLVVTTVEEDRIAPVQDYLHELVGKVEVP